MDIVKIDSIAPEFEKRFFDIPFGNSDFQNRKFIKEAQYTPERAYRALGLRLYDRINALREAAFNYEETLIDIDELKAGEKSGKFELRRTALELKRKYAKLNGMKKLVNDALHECLFLWSEIKQFPAFSRKDFENGEFEHFKIRLTRAARGLEGAVNDLNLITTKSKDLTRRR